MEDHIGDVTDMVEIGKRTMPEDLPTVDGIKKLEGKKRKKVKGPTGKRR